MCYYLNVHFQGQRINFENCQVFLPHPIEICQTNAFRIYKGYVRAELRTCCVSEKRKCWGRQTKNAKQLEFVMMRKRRRRTRRRIGRERGKRWSRWRRNTNRHTDMSSLVLCHLFCVSCSGVNRSFIFSVTLVSFVLRLEGEHCVVHPSAA